MANRKNQGSDKERDELEEEIENLKMGGWGEKAGAWLRENFVSLVLPIIAIVVLVAGILAFSGDQVPGDQTAGPVANQQQEQQQSGIGGPEQDEQKTTDDQQDEKDQMDGDDNQQPQDEDQQKETMDNKQQERQSITLQAKAGDGVTHLARKAIANHLEQLDQNARDELTAEHLVYAEDYVQNATGDFQLDQGQELTFSSNLLQEAIDASLELSPEQLNNLEQFSQQVPSFQTTLS